MILPSLISFVVFCFGPLFTFVCWGINVSERPVVWIACLAWLGIGHVVHTGIDAFLYLYCPLQAKKVSDE